MARYVIKIVSEERIEDPDRKCGPCAKKRDDKAASTQVRVGFTWMRGDDSFADMCPMHRKELGQFISGRILLGEWPDHMRGDFWRD